MLFAGLTAVLADTLRPSIREVVADILTSEGCALCPDVPDPVPASTQAQHVDLVVCDDPHSHQVLRAGQLALSRIQLRVVSPLWVIDCAKARRRLPDASYRIAYAPPVVPATADGTLIFSSAQFTPAARCRLRALVHVLGARFVTQMSCNVAALIVPAAVPGDDKWAYALANNIPIVSWRWLLDSGNARELLPQDPYRFAVPASPDAPEAVPPHTHSAVMLPSFSPPPPRRQGTDTSDLLNEIEGTTVGVAVRLRPATGSNNSNKAVRAEVATAAQPVHQDPSHVHGGVSTGERRATSSATSTSAGGRLNRVSSSISRLLKETAAAAAAVVHSGVAAAAASATGGVAVSGAVAGLSSSQLCLPASESESQDPAPSGPLHDVHALFVPTQKQDGTVSPSEAHKYDPSRPGSMPSELRRLGARLVNNVEAATHVVAAYTSSAVAQRALQLGKTLVSQVWVRAVTKANHSNPGSVVDPMSSAIFFPLTHRESVLRGTRVCLTGFRGYQRLVVEWIVLALDGVFTDVLDSSVAVLIVSQRDGAKFKAARKMDIPCVSIHWLEDCIRAWQHLPLSEYHDLAKLPHHPHPAVAAKAAAAAAGITVASSLPSQSLPSSQRSHAAISDDDADVRTTDAGTIHADAPATDAVVVSRHADAHADDDDLDDDDDGHNATTVAVALPDAHSSHEDPDATLAIGAAAGLVSEEPARHRDDGGSADHGCSADDDDDDDEVTQAEVPEPLSKLHTSEAEEFVESSLPSHRAAATAAAVVASDSEQSSGDRFNDAVHGDGAPQEEEEEGEEVVEATLLPARPAVDPLGAGESRDAVASEDSDTASVAASADTATLDAPALSVHDQDTLTEEPATAADDDTCDNAGHGQTAVRRSGPDDEGDTCDEAAHSQATGDEAVQAQVPVRRVVPDDEDDAPTSPPLPPRRDVSQRSTRRSAAVDPVMLPCEVCAELQPAAVLLQHQEQCAAVRSAHDADVARQLAEREGDADDEDGEDVVQAPMQRRSGRKGKQRSKAAAGKGQATDGAAAAKTGRRGRPMARKKDSQRVASKGDDDAAVTAAGDDDYHDHDDESLSDAAIAAAVPHVQGKSSRRLRQIDGAGAEDDDGGGDDDDVNDDDVSAPRPRGRRKPGKRARRQREPPEASTEEDVGPDAEPEQQPSADAIACDQCGAMLELSKIEQHIGQCIAVAHTADSDTVTATTTPQRKSKRGRVQRKAVRGTAAPGISDNNNDDDDDDDDSAAAQRKRKRKRARMDDASKVTAAATDVLLGSGRKRRRRASSGDEAAPRRVTFSQETGGDTDVPIGKRRRANAPVVMVSGASKAELLATVASLGWSAPRAMHQAFVPTAQLLIADDADRRVEKVICARASGMWVLRPSYLHACAAAASLADVPKQEHEWPQTRPWRLHVQRHGPVLRGVHILMRDPQLGSPAAVQRMFEAAGASVVSLKQMPARGGVIIVPADEPGSSRDRAFLGKQRALARRLVPAKAIIDFLVTGDPAANVDDMLAQADTASG